MTYAEFLESWFCGSDTRWNITALHLIGHPITPAAWDALMAAKAHGFTPEAAIERNGLS